ncbi:MAG TPA: helicase C-terminal domain-containing protein [Candidatus Elarobacter sp.]|jgi:ATP-dependent DNA helicase DinG|nr:helicase C-terminal domain-containing protein [Candidatus Elarobacter sp.]
MKLVDDAFAPGGPIASALPGFEAREGQLRMARLIQRGFLENVHTIVEAGTGVGKSLAYLVPALRAGARVVVSTGTIALQEQLVRKDIPLVTQALGIEARVVLLKGRNHYLCKAKFEKESGARLIAPSLALEKLWAWAERTETGDRAELDFTPRADDWESLDADADDCVGEYCHRFADCHFFARRDAARYADLVVVNHALFFLDLASGGALLPAYDFVVLDEAHQAEKYATAALTATLSPVSVNRMMRKLHRTYAVPAAFDAELDEGMRRLQQTLARVPGDKYPIAANEGVFEVLPVLRESFYRLENWVHANWKDGLRKPIENEAESERRRDLALRGVAAHIATVDRIESAAMQASSGALPADEIDAVAWVERGDGGERYEINAAPFSVADFLRASLFARTRSVVLTSATISAPLGGGLDDPFAFVKSSLGVDDAQQLIAPSPFDYAKQARLYVAPPRLNPKAVDFARRAAPLVEEILDRSGGRAFVLFTSYARLREVHALLRERIPFPVKVQGDLPRSALLDWFRTTKNAVLFATGTFWEGIDVVGDALSCVVIDRLPFPSPAEPLVAARIAALEAKGRSGFEHYMIPSAIVRLKQGFGRLIRSTSDRGVVALLDGRATSMRYGATIVGALPPATRITDLAALDELFREG